MECGAPAEFSVYLAIHPSRILDAARHMAAVWPYNVAQCYQQAKAIVAADKVFCLYGGLRWQEANAIVEDPLPPGFVPGSAFVMESGASLTSRLRCTIHEIPIASKGRCPVCLESEYHIGSGPLSAEERARAAARREWR